MGQTTETRFQVGQRVYIRESSWDDSRGKRGFWGTVKSIRPFNPKIEWQPTYEVESNGTTEKWVSHELSEYGPVLF